MGYVLEPKPFFLPLPQIDSADLTYCVAELDQSAFHRLKRSVAHHGILLPLLVETKEPALFRIVDGFGRFRLARELELDEVPALRIKGEAHELFLVALSQKSAIRDLTPLECARALVRLHEGFGVPLDRLQTEILPSLGVSPVRRRLDYLLDLGRLPRILWEAVARGLHPDLALASASWATQDQRLFVRIFNVLGIGPNKQRDLFTLLDEVALRLETSVSSAWKQSGAEEFLASESLSPADRFRGVKRRLFRCRFPTVAAYEDRLAEVRRNLALPGTVELKTPPFLEGARLQILLDVSSRKELEEALESLSSAPTLKGFDDCFDLL